MLTAQKGEEVQAQKALSELFELYWFPVYSYVRRKGNSPHDAEDLTQAFFEGLIRRGSLQDVDMSRGKLRGYLLTSLKNFLISQSRVDTAAKRGGGMVPINGEAAELLLASEHADHDSPDVLFERAWAQTLLKDVLAQLEAVYQKADRMPMFDAFSPHLLQDEVPNYRALSKTLGLSVVALRIQYHRMKLRYGKLLKSEIRHTVSTEEEALEEEAFLMKTLV